MNQTLKLTAAASLAALGTAVAHPETDSSANNGDWCQGFKNVGKFYENKDDAFIQSLRFYGRFQWQGAYIDGEDSNGNDFDDTLDEIRRLRFGAELKFLNGFKLKGNINLVADGVRTGMGRTFGYQSWDELTLSYTKNDVAGFDKLGISYGRHKVAMGHESHTSSKKIKTVERSALSNKIYSNRYTGVKLFAERGNWEGILGYFTLDADPALGGWSKRGDALYLSNSFKLGDDSNLLIDFFYNLDDNGSDVVGVGYKWVASVAYETTIANWNLMLNIVYGDNGDVAYAGANRDGNFHGLVIMPSTFIIEDSLEFVARYMYQGSEENQGVRTNSRYFRAPVHGGNVNGGRGDCHHSLYAGLNWYLCGDNAKFMFGVEHETLDTPIGDADATTLWAAYRMYF